ncbi:MAG: hypothetical protein AMXMBFR42_09380 [Burkholderiales bacterium]
MVRLAGMLLQAVGLESSPTTGNRSQRTEDRGQSRLRFRWRCIERREASFVGRPCGSAFRPTHFFCIATDPVGLKPDPPPPRRSAFRPTRLQRNVRVGLKPDPQRLKPDPQRLKPDP